MRVVLARVIVYLKPRLDNVETFDNALPPAVATMQLMHKHILPLFGIEVVFPVTADFFMSIVKSIDVYVIISFTVLYERQVTAKPFDQTPRGGAKLKMIHLFISPTAVLSSRTYVAANITASHTHITQPKL